jgi:small multidrug resistance family-3 protein
MKTFALFIATALAEIVGCYLPYLWLKQGRSTWLLIGVIVSFQQIDTVAAGRAVAARCGARAGRDSGRA